MQTEAGEITYKLRTNASKKQFPMHYGPGDAEMGAAGLGDTHDFAFMGDRLVRIALEANLTALGDGDLTELASGGLLADNQSIDRQDRPGSNTHTSSRTARRRGESEKGTSRSRCWPRRMQGAAAEPGFSAHPVSERRIRVLGFRGRRRPRPGVDLDAGNRLRRLRPRFLRGRNHRRGGRLSRSPLDQAGLAQVLDAERAAEDWFGYSGADSVPSSEVRLVWLSGVMSRSCRIA